MPVSDAEIIESLEKLVKLLKVGDEGRGTMMWNMLTDQRCQQVAEWLADAGYCYVARRKG